MYEVDPLACPTCGAEMRIIALITEHDLVTKILQHLKQKAETEKSRVPPEAGESAAASRNWLEVEPGDRKFLGWVRPVIKSSIESSRLVGYW
jgi:hypothetical protein